MSLSWKLAFAGLALTLLATVALWIDQRGYERAAAHCRQQQAEIERANREAVQRAAERLMREADELSLRNMELDDALARIDAATRDDDGTCGLGADSVIRLQSIR